MKSYLELNSEIDEVVSDIKERKDDFFRSRILERMDEISLDKRYEFLRYDRV